MRTCGVFSSAKCRGLMGVLLRLSVNYGLCESPLPNPISEILNWEPVGLSGGGGTRIRCAASWFRWELQGEAKLTQ